MTESIFTKQLLVTISLLLLSIISSSDAQTGPPEVPFANASDIDFSVEYSTDILMLGDILYAKVVMRNKADHPVQIIKSHDMRVFAVSSMAKDRSIDDCDRSGGSLLAIASGKEVVCYIALDMFSDDSQEDGEFNPFDSALNGQEIVLQADRSTLAPHQMKAPDYRVYIMQHEHKIKFGPPLIEKEAFDRAVAAELARDDLQPLKIFPYGLNAINSQRSYLMRRGFNYRDYNNTPLSISACLRVLSQTLPENSTLRRSASLTLASERLAFARPDEEAKAISDIIALLTKASPIERAFLKESILEDFQGSRAGTYRVPNVPKEIFDRFVQRLKDAGI